jgi:hypothetical protein
MMNWEQLILKAIVPISFVAIWALTALFNREGRAFPARPPGGPPQGGPRPGDPTLRWGPPAASAAPGGRRVVMGDDDILIIPNDPMRPARPAPTPPRQGAMIRRPLRGRAANQPAKKPEPAPSRPKLAGVSQNVNQSLAKPIELTPLTTIAPMTTATGSDLANAPSAPSVTSAVVSVSTLRPLMADPIRLREAFIVNELLQRPIALRGRRGHHG